MYFFGTLRIFSNAVVGLNHINLEDGGKVILPPSVLADLSDCASDSPMMFSISHPVTEVLTHCGVLEFSAEEGSVVAPSWVLDQIGVTSGEMVYIEHLFLPIGSYARFKPMSVSFLDITDQKAVLENRLRGFTCLTKGDIIPILYNNRSYLLKVVETQPGDAICIVNCDLEVEFEEPIGYVPSSRTTNEDQSEEKNLTAHVDSTSFSGQGYRLDGKGASSHNRPSSSSSQLRGIPDYDWKFGTLTFFRGCQSHNSRKSDNEFSAFAGSGRSLK